MFTLRYELKSGIANDGDINGGVGKKPGKLLSVGITALLIVKILLAYEIVNYLYLGIKGVASGNVNLQR